MYINRKDLFSGFIQKSADKYKSSSLNMLSNMTSWFGNNNVESNTVGVKALEGAKNIGNLLYSAVNKAGESVTEVGAKLKKSVEENSILSEFNKEQECFIREKNSNLSAASVALPPWANELSSLEAEHLSSQMVRNETMENQDVEYKMNANSKESLRVLDDPISQDFISDSLTTNHTDLDEIREEMKKLGLECTNTNINIAPADEDWEKELDAEINEFEVVPQESVGDVQWDSQIETTLDTIEMHSS
ncbi:synapse-associated protein of 47 kDa [Diaphorina citri]|uniref:Synapse-associated protein of 47 kDa n=1 Tax=Diaphorina citri TaxID=121845 RepID=A0A1S3D6Y1_DIACI|nr:synapse-associated protein of 47 kDa [Diaphorina citri]